MTTALNWEDILCFHNITPLNKGVSDQMNKKSPNPGSDEAIAQGCKCPVIDNCHGKGYMGIPDVFVYTENCPIHGHMLREPTQDQDNEA